MTSHCHSASRPQATARPEHETVDHSAARTGERPGEAAGGLRQRLLRDPGHVGHPSRYLAPLRHLLADGRLP